MILKIIIPGDAKAQDRPRGANVNGHVVFYDTKESKEFKNIVAIYGKAAMIEQNWEYVGPNIPVKFHVNVYFEITKSDRKSKKWMEEFRQGKKRPTKKPDDDNLLKICQDALNKILYHDDSQVVSGCCDKWYTEGAPYTEIIIEVL